MKKSIFSLILVISSFSAFSQNETLPIANGRRTLTIQEPGLTFINVVAPLDTPKYSHYTAYYGDIISESYIAMDTVYEVRQNIVYRTVRHNFETPTHILFFETIVDKYDAPADFWVFDSIKVERANTVNIFSTGSSISTTIPGTYFLGGGDYTSHTFKDPCKIYKTPKIKKNKRK